MALGHEHSHQIKDTIAAFQKFAEGMFKACTEKGIAGA